MGGGGRGACKLGDKYIQYWSQHASTLMLSVRRFHIGTYLYHRCMMVSLEGSLICMATPTYNMECVWQGNWLSPFSMGGGGGVSPADTLQ